MRNNPTNVSLKVVIKRAESGRIPQVELKTGYTAYAGRHGLNTLPGIVSKTRLLLYTLRETGGISNQSLLRCAWSAGSPRATDRMRLR